MHFVKYLLFYCLFFLRYLSANTNNNNDFNPYDVLGLTRTASDKEIRQAYKKLARHWHPDKNSEPNAHEQFTKINAAYEVRTIFLARISCRYSPFSRSYPIQPNDRIMMNMAQPRKTIIVVSIPIISVIHTISFVRISAEIFISSMNRPPVQRKSFIHENFTAIFSRKVIENRTSFLVVRISVFNVDNHWQSFVQWKNNSMMSALVQQNSMSMIND